MAVAAAEVWLPLVNPPLCGLNVVKRASRPDQRVESDVEFFGEPQHREDAWVAGLPLLDGSEGVQLHACAYRQFVLGQAESAASSGQADGQIAQLVRGGIHLRLVRKAYGYLATIARVGWWIADPSVGSTVRRRLWTVAEPASGPSASASSEGAEQVRPRSWAGSRRRYTGPRARPETLALFGSRVADMRAEANLSLEVFAKSSRRSPEWVRSIERGQCAPTGPGFDGLELGFFENESASRSVDLRATYRYLDEEPMGEEARRLRARHNISAPLSERQGQDPEGLVPLLHDIGYQDRLLTLTPLVALAAIATFILGARPWRGSGYDFIRFDFGALTFLGLVVAACLTFVMPSASGFLARLAGATRFGKVTDWYEDAVAIRNEEGSVSTNGNWHVPEEVLYSAPRHWGDLRVTSLEADLHERLIVVVTFGLVGAGTALAVAINASRSVADWVPWAALLVPLAIAMRLLVARRRGLAAAVPTLVAECYGLQPEDSSE
jgi:transcriptional regulator with XRE-family HTH domain